MNTSNIVANLRVVHLVAAVASAFTTNAVRTVLSADGRRELRILCAEAMSPAYDHANLNGSRYNNNVIDIAIMRARRRDTQH